MDPLLAWLVAAMVAWVPPGRGRSMFSRETVEEGRARYVEIAEAALGVAFDPDEAPLVGGKYGRAWTALAMLAVASRESDFHRHVDFGGAVVRGQWSWYPGSRGDLGQSYCLVQIKLGRSKAAQERGRELVGDRAECFVAGLAMMRHSFGACRRLPLDERLAAYAAGRCSSEPGRQKSRERIGRAMARFSTHPPPRIVDVAAARLLAEP